MINYIIKSTWSGNKEYPEKYSKHILETNGVGEVLNENGIGYKEAILSYHFPKKANA